MRVNFVTVFSFCTVSCVLLCFCVHFLLSSQNLWFLWEHFMIQHSQWCTTITGLLSFMEWSIQGSKYKLQPSPCLAQQLPPVCYKWHWYKQTYNWIPRRAHAIPLEQIKAHKMLEDLNHLDLPSIISIFTYILIWMLSEVLNFSGNDTRILDCL